ncbi:unnamed protein product [Allacma fusca]|uniref:Uncharacterized protein n=1 Tax=Allacma fusca TaxID=39272 RepID=A0A8J2J7W8_9HEXA|nr:unnamed protein product [Allacma fusca]
MEFFPSEHFGACIMHASCQVSIRGTIKAVFVQRGLEFWSVVSLLYVAINFFVFNINYITAMNDYGRHHLILNQVVSRYQILIK